MLGFSNFRLSLVGLQQIISAEFQELSTLNPQGWVVQRWVKFNPGLSKSYSSYEKITVLINYCSSNFPRKTLVDPKFTDQIHRCNIGNKTTVLYGLKI